MHTQGTVCNPSAKTSYGKPVYKISKVSSFSHSGDILGGNKKMGHVTITMPLSGTICRRYAGTSYDSAVYQILNLYVHSLRRYERR